MNDYLPARGIAASHLVMACSIDGLISYEDLGLVARRVDTGQLDRLWDQIPMRAELVNAQGCSDGT